MVVPFDHCMFRLVTLSTVVVVMVLLFSVSEPSPTGLFALQINVSLGKLYLRSTLSRVCRQALYGNTMHFELL